MRVGIGRRLARRSVPRSVRRAAHPVRTVGRVVTPKPIRHLQRDLWNAGNPVGAAQNALLDAFFSGGWQTASATPKGQVSAQQGPPDAAYDPYQSLRQALDAAVRQHQMAPTAAMRPVADPEEFLQRLVPFDPGHCFRRHQYAKRSGLHIWQPRRRAEADAWARAQTKADQESWEARDAAAHRDAEHAARQHQGELDAAWAALLLNEASQVTVSVDGALQNRLVPSKVLGAEDAYLEIGMLLPGPDVLGDRRPEFTPTGRPTTKPWGATARNNFYLEFLASSALAAVRSAFAAAPAVDEVGLAMVRHGSQDLEPLCWAVFRREMIQSWDWKRAAADLLAQANELELETVGRVHEVQVLSAGEDWPEYLEAIRKLFPPSDGLSSPQF